MNIKAMKTVVILLVLISAFSTLELIPMPEVMAQPTILLDPAAGHVGATVVVTGTIETADGAFKVRWDQTLNVTSGEAVGNDVTASFVVSPTNASPTGRDVTVELIDDTTGDIASTFFTLLTEFVLGVETPSPPKQLQEGNTTSIKINVTGGLPNTIYIANITVKNPANQTHSVIIERAQLSNTTTIGSGNGTTFYPTDFGGAHMNLTGTYYIAFNDTLATSKFFVGLTDKTEYRRNENVLIQAAGYRSSEAVKADVKIGESSVAGFPKNFTASSSGLATLSWKVPSNATRGTYRITLSNATSGGTVKSPSDVQNFNITGIVCFVKARNLADEAVEGVLVEVYNASAITVALSKGNTNSTGWIRFNLDEGNYTFKAFVKNMQVGLRANEVIIGDTELHMQLSLVNFIATTKTEEGEGIPLIEVALRFNYTTRDNKTVTGTTTAQTNATGIAAIRHLFTNRTYRVEAKRYGLLFSNTTVAVESSPALGLISLNLTLPNHTLSVHAIDSKGIDAAGVDLRVFEWASGLITPVESTSTNSSGDAFFSVPFGKYTLRAFKGGDFLSETVVDLVESSTFTFDLVTFNLDVVVSVFDYFGQPLANAEVKIERRIDQDFVLVSTQFTGSAGSAQFAGMVGGNSRVSVYLGGKLVAVQTQFLSASSNEVAFKVSEYVAVLGYPVLAGTFALLLFIVLLAAVVLVVARRRIMQMFRKPSKR